MSLCVRAGTCPSDAVPTRHTRRACAAIPWVCTAAACNPTRRQQQGGSGQATKQQKKMITCCLRGWAGTIVLGVRWRWALNLIVLDCKRNGEGDDEKMVAGSETGPAS